MYNQRLIKELQKLDCYSNKVFVLTLFIYFNTIAILVVFHYIFIKYCYLKDNRRFNEKVIFYYAASAWLFPSRLL